MAKKQPSSAPKDDSERGEKVLKEMQRLWATEGARGWSDALKKASQRVK